jgi:hypothetical protein
VNAARQADDDGPRGWRRHGPPRWHDDGPRWEDHRRGPRGPGAGAPPPPPPPVAPGAPAEAAQ